MPKLLLSTLAFLLLSLGVQYSQASCYDKNDHLAASGCSDSPCVVPGGCTSLVDGGPGINPLGEASVRIAAAKPRTSLGFGPAVAASVNQLLAVHDITSESKFYLSSSKFPSTAPNYDDWAWPGFSSTAALLRRQL